MTPNRRQFLAVGGAAVAASLTPEAFAADATDRAKKFIAAREVAVLYLQYLEKQVDPEVLKKITAKSNAVEQGFNVYRAKVDGQEMADSKVRSVLKESADSAVRRKVWEASKDVGGAVAADL